MKLDIHGGNLRAVREQYGLAGDVWDFSANINPLGLSPRAREAILRNIDNVIHYPDPEAVELKQALARVYGVNPAQLILGNGAVELIYLLMHHLRPRRVLIPVPTFSEYERAARATGAESRYFPLEEADGFTIYPDRLTRELEAVDILFLCNPNNPVGNYLTRAALQKILEHAWIAGVFTVVDESFLDFLPEHDRLTCRHIVTEFPRLFVLTSLTKFFALPGLRLGFAVGDAALVTALSQSKDPWNVNSLAQAAGVAALADENYIAATRAVVAEEKEFLYQAVNAIPGFAAYPPSANFLLCKITDQRFTATTLTAALARRGLIVRNCNSFPVLGERFIRVAVKDRAANTRLVSALAAVMEGENPWPG